jgi:ATP-dependent DNA helicase MPH1
MLQRCHNLGLMRHAQDPIQVSAFGASQLQAKLQPHQRQARWPLLQLSALARPLTYLLENSTQMCYNSLNDIQATETGGDGKGGGYRAVLAKQSEFQALVKEMKLQRNTVGFAMHPKIEKLKALAIEHFVNAEPEPGAASSSSSGPTATRMMVFSSFRDCVDEMVDVLNQHRPLLRAAPFVGQSTDKSGKKGLSQKEQIAVRHAHRIHLEWC